ncbi:MAG: hypothetical protein WCA35_20210 [Kovacikia sp.]
MFVSTMAIGLRLHSSTNVNPATTVAAGTIELNRFLQSKSLKKDYFCND